MIKLEIKKTGVLVITPFKTKQLAAGSLVELDAEEQRCAEAQGFLSEEKKKPVPKKKAVKNKSTNKENPSEEDKKQR